VPSLCTQYTRHTSHTQVRVHTPGVLTWHGKHDLAYLAEMQDRLGEAGLHGAQGMEDTS